MTRTHTQNNRPESAEASGAGVRLARIGQFCGAIGAALLVSSPVTFWLTGQVGAPVWLKLLIGVALVGIYIATNPQVFARMAGSRSTGLLALSVVSVVLVFGLVGVVNYVMHLYPKEWDLTRAGVHTLSKQTVDVLERLDKKVEVLAFFTSAEPEFALVEERLERYQRHSEQFGFRMVDPQSNPTLADQYDITQSGARIVVTAGEQDTRVDAIGEQELTQALISVAEPTQKKVYFLAGHGEGDIQEGQNSEGLQAAADAIRSEGYPVERLSLLTPSKDPQAPAQVRLNAAVPSEERASADPEGASPPANGAAAETGGDTPAAAAVKIPEDAAVLVVAGPEQPLTAPERAAIGRYLERGGHLLVMLEPQMQSGLAPLLSEYSIAVHEDIIVDTNALNRAMGFGAAAPIIQRAPKMHPITRKLRTAAIFITARSLAAAAAGTEGVDVQALMRTGETAWGETQGREGEVAELDEQDFAGPVTVAMAARKPVADSVQQAIGNDTRLVAVGDSDWISNGMVNQFGNRDLFLNTINWLAGEEDKITIRPNRRQASRLMLSGAQMGRLAFLSMDILPVLLVAVGLGVTMVRRQR